MEPAVDGENIWWIGGGALAVLMLINAIRESDKLHKTKHEWYLAGKAAAEALRSDPPGSVFYQIRRGDYGGDRYWIGKWRVADPLPIPCFRRWVPDPFTPKGDYNEMFGPEYGGKWFPTEKAAKDFLRRALDRRDRAPVSDVRACFNAQGEEVACAV